MADLTRMLTVLTARRSELELDDNEWEQLLVYMEAFALFMDREAAYNSLWKKYGAEDSYHHMQSKLARTEILLTGTSVDQDQDDPLDLINYTVFFLRNLREGRISNMAGPQDNRTALVRAVELAGHLFMMVDRQAWRDSGGDDGQGHYEGDYRAEAVAQELEQLKRIASA